MDEVRIKALYRAATARREAVLDEQLGEDIPALLTGYGWPADETSPVDRVAASATASSITRVVAELAPESEALARRLRGLASPAPVAIIRQRRWRNGLAVAASCAALALLFGLRIGPLDAPPDQAFAPSVVAYQAESTGATPDSDVISVVSFEAGEAERSVNTAIFSGNFGT